MGWNCQVAGGCESLVIAMTGSDGFEDDKFFFIFAFWPCKCGQMHRLSSLIAIFATYKLEAMKPWNPISKDYELNQGTPKPR